MSTAYRINFFKSSAYVDLNFASVLSVSNMQDRAVKNSDEVAAAADPGHHRPRLTMSLADIDRNNDDKTIRTTTMKWSLRNWHLDSKVMYVQLEIFIVLLTCFFFKFKAN